MHNNVIIKYYLLKLCYGRHGGTPRIDYALKYLSKSLIIILKNGRTIASRNKCYNLELLI